MRSSSISVSEEEKIDDISPIEIKIKTIFNKISNINIPTLEDFKIKKIIGKGTFGKVYLVQYKNNKEYYAMKSIKKEYLADENEIKSLLMDKKMLQNLNNPF